MIAKSGYEKRAHLYDLFDNKENKEFFFRYGSEAGEENECPLTPAFGGIFDSVLSCRGEGVVVAQFIGRIQ